MSGFWFTKKRPRGKARPPFLSTPCKLPDLPYNIIGLRFLERKADMKRIIPMSLCFLILLIILPQETTAQDGVGQLFKDIGKDVVSDPTTYAPSVIFFTAKKLDWDSSQVFFRNGYVEENYDYTISGKAKDTPISYVAGNRRIFINTLPVLE